MENKAPGTTPRPEGYETAQGKENFFHPQPKMKKSMQRSGLRMAKKVTYWTICITGVAIAVPMMLGPAWVNYVSRWEWVQRAEKAAKSIWTRRNEKDWTMYMTQRKNSWWEMLGFKRYNIGGDENTSDEIQKYK